MLKAVYKFEQISEASFRLSHGSDVLLTFSRRNLRDSLEALANTWGFSSKWVGCFIGRFNKQYPLPFKTSSRTSVDRLVASVGFEGIADYFRSKGFRVVKSMPVKDLDLIRCLEREGYKLDGILEGDVPYSTDYARKVADYVQ
jgi:hypothetical protein